MEVETVLLLLVLVSVVRVQSSLLSWNAKELLTVETDLGRIKGTQMKSQKEIVFQAFRGIRYAQPPIGKHRFANPVGVQPWTGVLDATKDGMICPQPVLDLSLMSEDCLFLNVYTRNVSGKAAVMVYIHGGGNLIGSSHSVREVGPQYLMDHDIVFVSLNYRLGPLGFLSTATEHAFGNFGYLDQVLALKWVQQHIDRFGGDPKSVTIFGESAGSMAVTLHLASPLSNGLFHRAIAMSGSATKSQAFDSSYWTRKLARARSCPIYNPENLLDCLRNDTWQRIINACQTLESFSFLNMKWDFQVDGNFLPSHPSEIFLRGDFSRVPLIAGITKDEFTFVVYQQEHNTGLWNDISLNFDKYAPELLQYNNSVGPAVAESLYDFYIGHGTLINDENLEMFGQMFTDSAINHGVHRLVDFTSRHQDIYYYRFDYQGRRGFSKDPNGNLRGVSHADDLQYLFVSKISPSFNLMDPEMMMVDRLTGLWTTFARTAIPTPRDEWQPSNNGIIKTFYIDKESYMGLEPYQDRMKLWDKLFPLDAKNSAALPVNSSIRCIASVFTFVVFLKNLL